MFAWRLHRRVARLCFQMTSFWMKTFNFIQFGKHFLIYSFFCGQVWATVGHRLRIDCQTRSACHLGDQVFVESFHGKLRVSHLSWFWKNTYKSSALIAGIRDMLEKNVIKFWSVRLTSISTHRQPDESMNHSWLRWSGGWKSTVNERASWQ